MAGLLKSFANLQISCKFLHPRVEAITVPSRGRKHLNYWPRKRHPIWLTKQTRVQYNENLTADNARFIKEVVDTKYSNSELSLGIAGSLRASPLKVEPIEPKAEWQPSYRRTGVIAKKIGIYPLWLKNGKRVFTTLLQVLDNHVVRYIPPEDYKPILFKRKHKNNPRREKLGCLVVGSDSCDPQKFTKEYCGLFTDSGVMPKRVLTRFRVSPEAALAPGTPLVAAHYKPGQIVDIRGKTIDRGFQGVCKRWGFKGGPASHGVTKTHRRPGNIGGGGEKGRVWPGTKMPGHMGNRMRIHKGAKILRINTKYNVLWIHGISIPGETNSFVSIYDTILPLRRLKESPSFPTYLPTADEPLPEELFCDELHPFTEPTIQFSEES
ncbi:39S ribosomal protein L3, mitochondrial [Neodiprion fabricii]|uniref:39S ribosomal protein L3, mitochondrial n=1 Tax=Neodiprion fabricii TaxID=2872261 RepID=UPI001ED8D492|nr:39S ribosomal protein L3, mitochondrial [Neodiprion fabricii]